MSENELSTVLKALVKARGISESELARRTGIGQPVIHRMISGETSNPKIETLRPIANHFELSINQLIGDEPLPKNSLPGKYSEQVRRWIQIPLLTFQQCVKWPNIPEDEIETYISTDSELSDKAYAVCIKDSTMEPRFPEGTILVIEPNCTPTDRDFAMVHITDQKQATFKQILIDGEDKYLKPLNNDFSVSKLTKEFRFLGVMVQARTNYPRNELLDD